MGEKLTASQLRVLSDVGERCVISGYGRRTASLRRLERRGLILIKNGGRYPIASVTPAGRTALASKASGGGTP